MIKWVLILTLFNSAGQRDVVYVPGFNKQTDCQIAAKTWEKKTAAKDSPARGSAACLAHMEGFGSV